VPYWLDRRDAPEPTERLRGRSTADLVVVGAGFTGLWTALLAKQRDPSLDVVVLEGRTTAHAASGRNGGFCSASLTHGLANGYDRFPAEIADLEKLGLENLDAIEKTVREHAIDCDWRRSGELTVAVEPWQVDGLRARVELAGRVGSEHSWLDGDQVRELVDSPTYLGGVLDPHGCAMVDPARLAWGLRRVCLETGVRIYENSPVSGLTPEADVVRVTTHEGQVRTRRVALATNAYPPLLRRLRHYVVPVWDYALMTEPLAAEQWASIGWAGHEGLSDAGNQFHYYRRVGDRILWGGWDAIYGFGNEVSPSWGQRQET
jgi:glycine/D-amino acid oxidase-like deaminating enzyme